MTSYSYEAGHLSLHDAGLPYRIHSGYDSGAKPVTST